MKDIPGYEGEYAATSCGRIWSHKTQRFLKPYDNGCGYLKVKLSKGGDQKTYYVHRLVCETYLPNPLGLPQVNHKNEVTTENQLNNLEWISDKENKNYGTRNIRISKNLSKPVYCVELDQVFDSLSAAAKAVGTTIGNLSSCLTGRSKTAKGYHWQYVINED